MTLRMAASAASLPCPTTKQLFRKRRSVQKRAEAAAPVDTGLQLSRLNFRYGIEGDAEPWRPLRAFDDGSKVYIEFPRGIARGEMPPVVVLGSKGDAELVNYRTRQNYYIVDRLFAAAELRLGGDGAKKVRIVRPTESPQVERHRGPKTRSRVGSAEEVTPPTAGPRQRAAPGT
jgi:type IV secretion system protein TrbG